jgi:hypothetical protein
MIHVDAENTVRNAPNTGGDMYAKIFDSILASSIWVEDSDTRIVWITLLTLADENGFARAVPSALARLANVPQDKCEKALALFMAPDPEDSSGEYEGRRITALPGGFFIYQHAKYRDLQNAEQRRATWRAASKKYRLKIKPKKATKTSTKTVNKHHAKSTEVPTKAVTHAVTQKKRGDSARLRAPRAERASPKSATPTKKNRMTKGEALNVIGDLLELTPPLNNADIALLPPRIQAAVKNITRERILAAKGKEAQSFVAKDLADAYNALG